MSATPTDVDTPTDGRPVEILDSPLEELSPTELHLESLRKKLERQQTAATGKIEETEGKLSNTRIRIDELKEQIAILETETLNARDDMHQAMGLAYALKKTVQELRQEETGETKGGGVGELRILIEAEEQHAKELGVTLVGDSPYTDEFLTTMTIDEGRAGGLVFEIKNDFRQKVTAKLADLNKALHERVPRSNPEYAQREDAYKKAEEHYDNASVDLANAEKQRDDLLEQIKHLRSTIVALNAAVEKADRVAVRIEEQGRIHETEDLSRARDMFDKKTAATETAKATLTAAEDDEKILEALVAECIKQEERIVEIMRKVSDLPALFNRAVAVHQEAPKLGRPLLGASRSLDELVSEAKADIDPDVVQIAPSLHARISYSAGHGAGVIDGAFAELEKGSDTLSIVLERFESAVIMAATERTDNLNFEAIATLLECGEELNRFLRNEWQRLSVGTPEGIAAVINRARDDVEKALEPLAVLRKAFPKAPVDAKLEPTRPEHARPAEGTAAAVEVTTDTADNMGPALEESLTAEADALLKEVLAAPPVAAPPVAAPPVAAPPAPAAEAAPPPNAPPPPTAENLTREETRIGVAPTAPTTPRRRRGAVEE